MRQMIGLVSDLAARLEELEERTDERFRIAFDAIKQLMEPPPVPERRPIGFRPEATDPGRDGPKTGA